MVERKGRREISDLPIAKVRLHREGRMPGGRVIGMRITKHDGTKMEVDKVERVPASLIEQADTVGDVMYLRYIETDEHFALSDNAATEADFNAAVEAEKNSPTAMLLEAMALVAAQTDMKLDVLKMAIRLMQSMRKKGKEIDHEGLIKGIRVLEAERRMLQFARQLSVDMDGWVPGPDYLRQLNTDDLILGKDD